MNWIDKDLKFSLNFRLINKDERRDKLAHREGWQNWDLPIGALALAISKGVAYCAQLQDGIRDAQHFLASDIASVDIDATRSVEDALQDPFCQSHLTLLYLTASYTVEEPRFRLIFALPRTITDPLEQRAVNRALAMRLAGDGAVVDPARLYYGSDLAEPRVFDRGIPLEVLEELIEQGKTIALPERASSGAKASSRANRVLDAQTEITTASGVLIRLGDVNTKTSVHCPFHYDRAPSAFVALNPKGSRYMHCSKCKTTWWMGGKEKPTFDFDAFDRVVKSFVGDARALGSNTSPLFPGEVWAPSDSYKRQVSTEPALTVYRQSNSFLQIDRQVKGVVFVKSPKGSGKTTVLPQLLAPYRSRFVSVEDLEERYDDESPPQSLRSDVEVLLIGHRRALIRDLSQRLDLHCYLDEVGRSEQQVRLMKKAYGVCVDSLFKVAGRRYGVVIIDEVEQVLRHFLSDTIEKGRERLFGIFSELLRQADCVIALDADLDWPAYDTICSLAGSSVIDKKGKPITIYHNDPPPKNRELKFFRSARHMLDDFIREVKAGSRIFYASNSKAHVDAIGELLDKLEPKPTYQKVTAENSTSRAVQEFIVDIKSRIFDYQVIVTSPSLGTGLDITVPDDGPRVDVVYGHFEGLINTHFDIDQQLGRVRNPGDVRVWVSPRTFNFETNEEVVRSDLIERCFPTSLLDMASRIVSVERASKNHLRQNFLEYKRARGWTIHMVDPEQGAVQRGKDAWDIAQTMRDETRIARLFSAKPIVQSDFLNIEERIEEGSEVSEGETLSYYRALLEGFYRAPIDAALVRKDDRGRHRARVRLYERLLEKLTDEPWIRTAGVPEDKVRQEIQVLPTRHGLSWLMHALLSATPVYQHHQFKPDAVYTSSDLPRFVELAEKYKLEIENLLGRPLPRDLRTKPVSFLKTLLWEAGVRQERVERRRSDGKVTYTYRLVEQSIADLNAIVQHRKDHPERWRFLHDLHGLEGALYKREMHLWNTGPSGANQHAVFYLVPYTAGAAIIPKRTAALAKKYGFIVNPRMLEASQAGLEKHFSDDDSEQALDAVDVAGAGNHEKGEV